MVTAPGRPAPTIVAPAARAPSRLTGIDLARALAFAGMLLAHFAFSRRATDPGWLAAVDSAADGRAAPLFCVLLGVGSGLLIRRGTPDRVLVRRGLALLVLGLALWPLFDRVYLILPQYGLLLLVVPLLRRLRTAWLLPAALVAFAVPSTAAALLAEHGLRASPQPSDYGDLLDLPDVVRNLVWTGGYPMAGWVGFALVGLWLGRLALHDRGVQVRLLLGGAAVAAVQPLLALAWSALTPTAIVTAHRAAPRAEGLAAFLDGTAHSNRFAWYVLASATAVAVIAACLLVVDADRLRLTTPLVRLGQLALTAYVAHLVLGQRLVWDWLDRSEPPLTTEVLAVVAVVAGFTLFAVAWRSRFRRGPLEAALRAVSG